MHHRRRPGRPTQCAAGRARSVDSAALPGLSQQRKFPTRRLTPPADTMSALRASPKHNACCDRSPLLRTVRFRTLLHAVHQRCTGKPRLDLIGARPTSAGARLPRIGALCVRADSSFNKRKTPWITRRKSPRSHAPAVHTMGHKRSRRRPHRNADDGCPVDSRSWRQPDAPKSRICPTHRHRTSTVEADSNSHKFNGRR